MIPDLSHAHRNTYEAILRHPAPHNLQWHDVRSMLGAIADIAEEPNGNIKVSRNGKTLILHPERHKDVRSQDQVKELRDFIEHSGTTPPPVGAGANLLIVINSREARIYRTELGDSVAQRITPDDPDGHDRHVHSVSDDFNGQRRPGSKSYYDAIAKAVQSATHILLFGAGTGSGSAMQQLQAELTLHHKDVAGRIVGSQTVDESHLTEDQLLAMARDFYTNLASQPSTRD